MKPLNVALLGIGTVGGGTFTVLRRNQEEIQRRAGRGIVIKVVADKDLERARRIVGDAAEVMDDAFAAVARPDIDIVVELIGGYHRGEGAGGKAGVRVEIDDRNEKIGKKIRDTELMKVPYKLVVGEKEANEQKLSVRRQGKGDMGVFDVQAFIDLVSTEIPRT